MHTEDKQFLRRETRLPADTYMADTTPYAVDTVTVYVTFYEAHKPYCQVWLRLLPQCTDEKTGPHV